MIDLPYDMLAVILGKVGEGCHRDFQASICSCKMLQKISKFPDALKALNLDEVFPPPWDRIPEKMELLHECAKSKNIHAIFLRGLFDYFYLKQTSAGFSDLSLAAQASHPEAMYIYGMVLINQGQFSEGSNYLKKLWKEQGIEAVRRCHLNCRNVILELSQIDMLLSQIELGDDCSTGNFDEV